MGTYRMSLLERVVHGLTLPQHCLSDAFAEGLAIPLTILQHDNSPCHSPCQSLLPVHASSGGLHLPV